MNRITTIRDISKHLNISVSTVSRALRDTHDVSSTTKEKVLAVATELNYKPNFNAIGLRRGITHNIGVILPFITNYYFSTVITGIQEVAYKNNYNVILFVTNDSSKRELSIVRKLPFSCLDGLLVSITSDSDSCDHFQEIINNYFPIVFFDRVANSVIASKVLQDDYKGAFEAVEHLIKQGYTKIAHITGSEKLELTRKRVQGYRAALEKHDLLIEDKWIINSGFSQAWGELDTDCLMQYKEKPDAIFAVNDGKAIGAMISLKKRNIAIGKDIGVVGFTDDPVSSLVSPSLSTISEPAYDIGKQSCELLLKHISKREFFPKRIILQGALIKRESTIRR